MGGCEAAPNGSFNEMKSHGGNYTFQMGTQKTCPCGSFPFMEPLPLHRMDGRREEENHAGPIYFYLLTNTLFHHVLLNPPTRLGANVDTSMFPVRETQRFE